MSAREISEQTFDEDVPSSATSHQCPDCGGHVSTDSRETVCDDYGLIIEENRLDRGPEWRSSETETRKRTGASLTAKRHDRGLSTEIGHHVDAYGNQLSSRKRRRLTRLRREHGRAQWRTKRERNLATGLGEVRRITSALGLPDSICEQACTLFRTAQNEDLLHGRSIEAIAAASIYGTCRCAGLSRTLEEVTRCAQVAHERVRNAYKVLNRELELPTQPVSPAEYVPTIVSELEVCDQVRRRALELARLAEDAGITVGVNPIGFAAACVYKAAREHGQWPTQAEIAALANIAENTLRKHRDALEKHILQGRRCR